MVNFASDALARSLEGSGSPRTPASKPKPLPSLESSSWSPPLPGAQAQELVGLLGTLENQKHSPSLPAIQRPRSAANVKASGSNADLKASSQRASSARLARGHGPSLGRRAVSARERRTAASNIGAMRVVHDGQHMLILEHPSTASPKQKAVVDPVEALEEEIRRDAEREAKQKKEAAARLKSTLSTDGPASQKLRDSRVQSAGPTRRALEEKLSDLRKNPRDFQKLQERVATYVQESLAKHKDLIDVNKEQIRQYRPEIRQRMFFEQQRLREERLSQALARKAAIAEEREQKMIHLAEKHDLMKARLAAEREAEERHREKQKKDAKVVAFSVMAARMRVLSLWLQVDRMEREFELYRGVCAKRIQRWWRFRLRIIRRRRSKRRALQVCKRWKIFVARQKRWRDKGADDILSFLETLSSKEAIVFKLQKFRKHISLLERFVGRCFLRFDAMTTLVCRQWQRSEEEFLEKRSAILESLNSAPAEEPEQPQVTSPATTSGSPKPGSKVEKLKKMAGGGDSFRSLAAEPSGKVGVKQLKAAELELAKSMFSEPRSKSAKGGKASKGPHVLPHDDPEVKVPDSVKIAVSKVFIRLRRTGFRMAFRTYQTLVEEYEQKVIEQEAAIAQDIANGTELADHTKLVPPEKPSLGIMGTNREIGILMQLGVLVTLYERQRDIAKEFGRTPLEAPDIEQELLSRGIDMIPKKRRKQKQVKVKGEKRGDGEEKKGEGLTKNNSAKNVSRTPSSKVTSEYSKPSLKHSKSSAKSKKRK
mmetsp:Transcript_26387/g.57309  ORF Transcript_26387/g.57309 Transcript_26387/m.57309 type:complete len:766 (-) Transcript_26387:125-2422(-)|eukprot:CAMPEP_0118936470 /NCGR_PEP_ID=MMETSP1169-20130426/19079_1 /TAXON_ID=36882 /ORGANISM="Pyramimonas obovata, Strain CCMP722" /LENGTH=765 /DNA_ID=CAMNT_0006879741 /DNA_START=216 /DNA_END=2513 /DNA_ORIENTATION=+